MKKQRKLDFILEERDDYKLIFRFYPRQSSCHSFDEKPPTKPEDVYKVYYSYAIIEQSRWEPDEPWESEILFYQYCDECSIIDEIGEICLLLSKGIEEFTTSDNRIIPLLNDCKHAFGMGTNWFITKHTCIEYGYEEDNEDIETIYYRFMLFKYNGVGFKFTLKKDKIKEFGEYLLKCCDYMLKHGNPI